MFTCVSCHLLFDSPDDQKDHFHTALHRENVKRKATGLPHISAADAARAAAAAAAKEAAENPENGFYCASCSKRYKSQAALDSHLASKKHKEAEAAAAAGVPKKKGGKKGGKARSPAPTTPATADAADAAAPAGSDEEGAAASTPAPTVERPGIHATAEDWIAYKIARGVRIPVERECIVCGHCDDDVDRLTSHAVAEHGFYIPDAEYANVAELMQYVAQKVGVGNACLRCDKVFESLAAVRNHMIDLGHGRLPLGAEEMVEYMDYYDYSKGEEDEGESGDDEAGEGVGYTARAAAAVDRAAKNVVRPVDVDAFGSLVLSNGAQVVSREMAPYFKQKVRTEEQLDADTKALQVRMGRAHRAVIGVPQGLRSMPEKERKAEVRARRARAKAQNKWNEQVGVRNSNLFVVRPDVLC
jgi:pre-60S factor REI1